MILKPLISELSLLSMLNNLLSLSLFALGSQKNLLRPLCKLSVISKFISVLDVVLKSITKVNLKFVTKMVDTGLPTILVGRGLPHPFYALYSGLFFLQSWIYPHSLRLSLACLPGGLLPLQTTRWEIPTPQSPAYWATHKPSSHETCPVPLCSIFCFPPLSAILDLNSTLLITAQLSSLEVCCHLGQPGEIPSAPIPCLVGQSQTKQQWGPHYPLCSLSSDSHL